MTDLGGWKFFCHLILTKLFFFFRMGLQEYQVVGRHLPTESDPTPKIYRMRIFAPNEVVAKSRFWYFLRWLFYGFRMNIILPPVSPDNSKRSKRPMARLLVWTSYVSFWYPFAALKRQAEWDCWLLGLSLRHFFLLSSWGGWYYRFMRRSLWKSRTLVSGSVMIRGLERTICTRNSVTLAVRMLSRACTRIWLLGIVLASARSTYVVI